MKLSRQVAIQRWRDGDQRQDRDQIACEIPVALVYNGVSHTVMLASPADLEDFALGFSLSEGILTHPRELYDLDIEEREDGVVLSLSIASERFEGLQAHRRSMAGRTGCGLCGAESLEQVARILPPVGNGFAIAPSALHKAADSLDDLQPLARETGATHAAAWFTADGKIGLLREDVGRHNALDKVIGALAKAKIKPDSGGFLVSSRASYEMVQKTASAGVQLLAAISAPTALAIDKAKSWNMSLVGFLRPGSHVIYSGEERLSEWTAQN